MGNDSVLHTLKDPHSLCNAIKFVVNRFQQLEYLCFEQKMEHVSERLRNETRQHETEAVNLAYLGRFSDGTPSSESNQISKENGGGVEQICNWFGPKNAVITHNRAVARFVHILEWL